MTIRCEKCGKEIDVIASVELKPGYNQYPAFLHGECYRVIAEKEWMYDQLDK